MGEVRVDGDVRSYPEDGPRYPQVNYDTAERKVIFRETEEGEAEVLRPEEAIKRGLLHPNLGPKELRPQAKVGRAEDALPLLNLASEAGIADESSLTEEEAEALERGIAALAERAADAIAEIETTDMVKLVGGTSVED